MIVSQEGRPAYFDIVNPLSKSKEVEIEDLNLFFGLLGVFYLLAVGVHGMEQSLMLPNVFGKKHE